MLYEKSLPRETRRGYTSAVDYWSLGVTIFVLLTGGLPFPPDKVAGFMAIIAEQEGNTAIYDPPDYAVWYNWVTSNVDDDLLTETIRDFLTGLLTIDETKRLGNGVKGVRKVKNHLWFKNISWNLLEQKLVKPPGYESPKSITDKMGQEAYPSFNAMIDSIGEDFIVYKFLTGLQPYEQDFFRPW